MIYPIRYFGDPILRQVARPVTRFDANLRTLAADMFETMFDANGIGLAATQIGIPRQLFVAVEIDPLFDDPEDEEAVDLNGDRDRDGDGDRDGDRDAQAAPRATVTPPEAPDDDRDPRALDAVATARGVTLKHVIVNPSFVVEHGEQRGPDGCLSLPGLFVNELQRFMRVRLRYQDLDGGAHVVDVEGRFAHVLQHEYDHLHGVLFFDRLPVGERQEFLEANRRELAEMQRQARALLKELRHAPVPMTVG